MSTYPLLKAMRPLRALLIALLYTGIAWMQLRFSLKQPAPQQALCTAGLVLPFFWASLVAGGMHGVMHRVAFPLLPGALRAARSLYLALTAAGLLASLVFAWLIDHEAPLAGIAGLGALVSAIPLLNTRRRPLYRGLMNPWFPVCFTLLGVLVIVFPARLHAILTTAPWLVLLTGLTLAALILRHAFERRQVRARQEVFFVSVLGSLDLRPQRMVANNQFYSRELVRTQDVTLKTSEIRLHTRAQLGEFAFWTERMQQVRFGGLGKAPKSPLKQLITLSLAALLPLLLTMILIGLLIRDFSLHTQAQMIVDFTRQGAPGVSGEAPQMAGAAAFILFAFPFLIPMIAYPVLRVRLRTWMPVSRQMQAKVIFRSALRLVLCYQPMVLIPIVIPAACAWWLGVPLGFWVVATSLATALATLPLAPLSLCASFVRSAFLRALLPAVSLMVAVAIALVLPRHHSTLLSPLCILAFLGATAAGFALLKRMIDGRYLRGDLDTEMNSTV